MKIGEHVFDAGFRARCSVVECGRAAIDSYIRTRHYLYSWPGVVVRCYAMLCDGLTVGACVYALPPAATYARYGVPLVWELARLWIDDAMPRNAETWFISKTVRDIRVNRKDVFALVSYADPSADHQGTIYRAGNWQSDGRTDDERKSPRCDYWVGDRKYSRKAHVPKDQKWERRPRASKFRFVYRLRQIEALAPTGKGPTSNPSQP